MKPGKDPKKHHSRQLVGEKKENVLTDTLESEFLSFIAYHSAKRFSKNMRRMLLEFLMHDGALEAIYLKELLYDMEGLFELLDAIQNESETSEEQYS